jgi:hypothetical protein
MHRLIRFWRVRFGELRSTHSRAVQEVADAGGAK